jgi:hypothetical protein
MSENNERPAEESAPSSPAPTDGHEAAPEPKSDGPQDNDRVADNLAFIEQLKQGIEKTRLPADLREQILASLPPPEEMERMYREMQENGGLSSEEFFASLGLETGPQP